MKGPGLCVCMGGGGERASGGEPHTLNEGGLEMLYRVIFDDS